MPRQTGGKFSSPLPSERLTAHQPYISPSANRFLHGLSERSDHIIGPHNSVGDRLGRLPTGDIEDQSRWTIEREDECRMPLRPPPPGQIGNDRIVGVETGEVIDLGVVVLRRPAPRPRDQARETARPRRITDRRLPRLVLSPLDSHRDLLRPNEKESSAAPPVGPTLSPSAPWQPFPDRCASRPASSGNASKMSDA